MQRRYTVVETSPWRRSSAQVSWQHARWQRYSVYLQPAFWQDKPRRKEPNDRRIWWHCRGHSASIWSLTFPYESTYRTMKAAQIGMQMVTCRHKQVFYPVSLNVRSCQCLTNYSYLNTYQLQAFHCSYFFAKSWSLCCTFQVDRYVYVFWRK